MFTAQTLLFLNMACESYQTLPTFPCGCFANACPKISSIGARVGFRNFFVKEVWNNSVSRYDITYWRTISQYQYASITTNRYTRAQVGTWPQHWDIQYTNPITAAELDADAKTLYNSLNFDGLLEPTVPNGFLAFTPKFNSSGQPSGYDGPVYGLFCWRNFRLIETDPENIINCPAACYSRTNFPTNDNNTVISKIRVFSKKKLCVRTMVQNTDQVDFGVATLDNFDISCREVIPDPEVGHMDFEAPPVTFPINEYYTSYPSIIPQLEVRNTVSVFEDCSCEDLLP